MRHWLLFGIVCVVLVAASAASAQAGPVFAAGDSAGAGKPMGVEKGLFKGAIEVSLWTIMVFLILMFLLTKFAWGPIRDGLNQREQSIARDKREAELARKEASEMREKLQQEMAKVNDQIRQMMDKARQDAQQTTEAELARGKAELQAERQRLLREVQTLKDQALQEIWNQGAQLATLISSKAIRKSLDYSDHRALLTEALDEFKGSALTRKGDLETARA